MRYGWLTTGLILAAMAASGAHGQEAPKQIKIQILNATGQDAGFATFKTVKKGAKVKIELKNLEFGLHAVHIHQNPVCDAPDFKGAGGHFNPDGKHHGYLNPMGRRASLSARIIWVKRHSCSSRFRWTLQHRIRCF